MTNIFINLYLKHIKLGIKTIDDVPSSIREQVQKLLDEERIL